MSPEVAALVGAQRVREAAELAAERGESDVASELFERACEFGSAAKAALANGDCGRAVGLAAVARDDALAQRALAALGGAGACAARVGRGAAVAARRPCVGGARTRGARRRARARRARGSALGTPCAPPRSTSVPAIPSPRPKRSKPSSAETPRTSNATSRSASSSSATANTKPPFARSNTSPSTPLSVAKPSRRSRKRSPRSASLKPPKKPRASSAPLGGPLPDVDTTRSPAPPAADMQRRLYGRYEVVREVASTATSRVLECIDSVRGERVAVKIFAGWECAAPAATRSRDSNARCASSARSITRTSSRCATSSPTAPR